jgi:hypothetical protein
MQLTLLQVRLKLSLGSSKASPAENSNTQTQPEQSGTEEPEAAPPAASSGDEYEAAEDAEQDIQEGEHLDRFFLE